MKKIALLASLMAVAGVSSAWAVDNGTITVTGTVPAIREVAIANGGVGTVDLSAMTTSTLTAADFPIASATITAKSNHEDWTITAVVTGTGAGTGANATNVLGHASNPANGHTNVITVNSVSIGGNALPYTAGDNTDLLNLAAGTAVSLNLSSASPLIAGNYTGSVLLTVSSTE